MFRMFQSYDTYKCDGATVRRIVALEPTRKTIPPSVLFISHVNSIRKMWYLCNGMKKTKKNEVFYMGHSDICAATSDVPRDGLLTSTGRK